MVYNYFYSTTDAEQRVETPAEQRAKAIAEQLAETPAKQPAEAPVEQRGLNMSIVKIHGSSCPGLHRRIEIRPGLAVH